MSKDFYYIAYGNKEGIKEETMDEKDKELQDLRRKVSELEEAATLKDNCIKAQSEMISTLLKTRNDYLALRDGLNKLVKDLESRNQEA